MTIGKNKGKKENTKQWMHKSTNGTTNQQGKKIEMTLGKNSLCQSYRLMEIAYLCPEAVAIGDGPLGFRGSSHVLISIITLSKD